MISLAGEGRTLCDGVSRREALRLGGLALVGLTLPELLGPADLPTATTSRRSRARSRQ